MNYRNFFLDIIRNIFTIMIMAIVLYLNDNTYVKSDYILLAISILVGIIAYYSFPILIKKIKKIAKMLSMRGYYEI